MDNKSALEEKYQKILEKLGEEITFYMDDIQDVFPDMKKSSLYWNMSKLVEKGYLKRVRNGVYAFNEWYGKKNITLSDTAVKIANIMDESGFEYCISGLDVLQKYMQHIPEQYPCILFINKDSKEEVKNIFQENGMETLLPAQIKEMHENYVLTGKDIPQIVLYQTENFEDVMDGVASIEKAFVDLFYAVTRNEYPLALQELVRIYENVVRLGILDKKKMVSIAAKRNLQYDIRYIAESKYITTEAHKFVEILKREE
ncbi:MAG: hypothetical protein PHR92_04720 [Lachnospiraceae bacterium]|nr:hypothetical protein [Lachnospiraceae bacterium]MDD2957813.1 hypothetical protein [Lachnospiraceae bacterium]